MHLLVFPRNVPVKCIRLCLKLYARYCKKEKLKDQTWPHVLGTAHNLVESAISM